MFFLFSRLNSVFSRLNSVFSRLNTLCSTLATSLGLRPEGATILIAALAPLEQAIDPRGGLANRFSNLPLGRALLLSSRYVFSGGM